jgi:uncharacterized surface protein with fasciclin (FAS1) repeats
VYSSPIVLLLIGGFILEQLYPQLVGGAAMHPSKKIVENAVNSKDHTTILAAVKAAGLLETLQSNGLFTLFAPTKAFDKLPEGKVSTLLKPENKELLAEVLTCHVLFGSIDSKTLVKLIKKNGGTFSTAKVNCGQLNFTQKGKDVFLKDQKVG